MNTFMLHANKVKKDSFSRDVQFEIESMAKSEGKDAHTFDDVLLYSRFPNKDIITVPNGINGSFEYEFELSLDETHFVNCNVLDKTNLIIPVMKGYAESFSSFIIEKNDKSKPAFCFFKNTLREHCPDERIIVVEF